MTKGYKPQYTPYYFQLEKRIVFDGAAAETLVDTVEDAAAAENLQQAVQESIANDTEAQALDEAVEVFLQSPPATEDQQTTENTLTTTDRLTDDIQSITSVLFVDSGVQNYEQLIQGVDKNVAVVILDSSLDGVRQIADALGSYSNLESIQILSHGGEGQVSLGNTSLNNSTIDTYAEELKIWGNSLSADGDILLFGCYVAANEGSTFVNRLADLTEADIAASDDLTGNALLGGDWDLEKETGAIEATLFNSLATLASYKESLAISISGSTADWDVVLKGSILDYKDDLQANGPDLDLIGDADNALLYVKFDDKGDADDTNDEIGFRIRVDSSKSSSASQFSSGYVFIGVDADKSGSIDFFISISNKSTNGGIVVWSPGSGDNTAPSNTSIQTPDEIVAKSALVDGTNYSFLPVSNTTDPSATYNDLNSQSNLSLSGNYDQVDHFISFKFSFADLVTAVQAKSITLTKDTSLQYTVATATNSNSFNSDIAGYNGSADNDTTYAAKGAFSAVGTFSNSAPVITSDGGGTTATASVLADGANSTIAVTTVTATDSNGDTPIYSLSGGADQAKFDINTSTGALTINGTTAGAGTYVVEVTVKDGSGADALSDTQTITVTVSGSNNAPTVSTSTKNGTEDTTMTFASSDFSGSTFDGNDTGDTLKKIKITSLPSNGTLRNNGATVSVNDEIVTANISNLTFVPNADWNGSASLGWNGSDGIAYAGTATTMTLSIAAVNDAPTISNLNSDTLAYTAGDDASIIDQGTVSSTADVDSTDFDTGTLTVSISANRVSTEDKLAIKNTGTGSGEIGITGSNVTYGGTTIGTFTGGTGTDNLVITFNSGATPAAATALIKSITYENTNTSNPTASSRTVGFTLTDGDSGTSTTSNATVTVSAETTTTTTEEAPLTLLSTNPKTTTTNPAAGAGKSDENNNTISGTSGNQGNDKDVGNAGGGTGNNTNNNLNLEVPDDDTYNPAAGAGGSDENDNTISGTSGNQGNDKDVGNAGGNKGKGGGDDDDDDDTTKTGDDDDDDDTTKTGDDDDDDDTTTGDDDDDDSTKPIFTSSQAEVRTTDSGARQFVMSNMINVRVAAKIQIMEEGEAAEESESDEVYVKIQNLPQNGTVSHDGKGGFVYVAKIGFEGTDSFSYTVQDADGNSVKGTITVNTTTGSITHTQTTIKSVDENADAEENAETDNEGEDRNEDNTPAPIEGVENTENQEDTEQEADGDVSKLEAEEGEESEKIAKVMGKEILSFQEQIHREANSFDIEVDELLEVFLKTA